MADVINWIEIALNAVIAFIVAIGVGLYIRFKVKPKIEEIYEYNREYRIRSIVMILELSDWNMEKLFEILEQNNCVGAKFLRVNLSPEELEETKERAYRLKLAYDDVYERIAEAKQYVSGDELLLFLDFIEFSKIFADELSAEKYNPQWIRRRGIVAKKLIKYFQEFFTEDFVKKWEDVECSRLQ